jgi:hypothetical protein
MSSEWHETKSCIAEAEFEKALWPATQRDERLLWVLVYVCGGDCETIVHVAGSLV